MKTYLVRESARAKHVRLHVSVEEGLVVTVPSGFDRAEVPAILQVKRSWIEGSARRIEGNVLWSASTQETGSRSASTFGR